MDNNLVKEMQAALQRHVIGAWFPRCFDDEHGGFLCDFDRAWRPLGPQEKLLEFQARQLLTAAEACALWPGHALLLQAVERGLAVLRGPLWDAAQGGWFHRTDRAGQPLEQASKHVHGAAYAIQACCAAHEATGDAGALALALAGFEWMERHAYDPVHGGYVGFLDRNNRPILQAQDWPQHTDTIGTRIGWKDVNVHSDLLEALGCLHRLAPRPVVTQRLGELVDLFCDRLLKPGSDLHFYYEADWRPVPGIVNYGYEFQTVFRLLLLRGQLPGPSTARIESVAAQLMDRALQTAWDADVGGCRAFAAPPGSTPVWLEHVATLARSKPWWVQTEMLKAALAMSLVAPQRPHYRAAFERQWAYFRDQFFDRRYGGSTMEPAGQWSARRGQPDDRQQRAAAMRKGCDWKDASHDGRALIYTVQALRAASA